MDEILELETRRKIYELVLKNQGLHLSKIAEILKMNISLVEYHLLFLERNDMVYSDKEQSFTRYYTRGGIGTSDKKILSLLRQEVPLKIVLFLLKTNNSPHKEILKICNIAPSTLSYHLKKLERNGIISVTTFGDKRGYSIVNKGEIMRLLIQHKPYNVFESFKDIWGDLRIV
jgi:predicted transcriptional regulator